VKTYIYRDHSQNSKVIFETQAEGISTADVSYKNATGKDPAKQPYVGCEVKTKP
jgi:hypothetical protein